MTPALTGPGEGTDTLGGSYNQKFYMGATSTASGYQVCSHTIFWYDDGSEIEGCS